ncbi:MAG: YkgJ family cysteine cluster protein [Candidatus Auribacterota bacterium]|nr:YkgJ family cysteine cluster protein [Candidatus Auribacterota bacterium]
MEKIPLTRFEAKPDDDRFCSGCSACCRWSGDVVFSPHALAPIATLLDMDERDCAELYFDLADDRHHLKAVDTADGRCPFLVEDNCIIYHLRPSACRSFPYRWQRPERALMRQCRLYHALLWREKEDRDISVVACRSEIIPRKREAGVHSPG